MQGADTIGFHYLDRTLAVITAMDNLPAILAHATPGKIVASILGESRGAGKRPERMILASRSL
jgi:hypothetical protein